jgi:hypothetical protein
VFLVEFECGSAEYEWLCERNGLVSEMDGNDWKVLDSDSSLVGSLCGQDE